MPEMDIPGSRPPDAGVAPSPVATAPGPVGTEPVPEGIWRFTEPTTESAVPRLRRTVRDLIRRQGVQVPEETLADLLLILTELAGNAVQHAALLSPAIGVEVSLHGGWLRVAVEDDHPYRPKALDADPEQQTTGGRGLLLVKTLTAEAGGLCDVEQTGSGGKVVWAALPLLPFTSPLSPG